MIGKFRSGSKAGMTLLELLIALALLALITGGLASSLSLSLRLYDRAQALDEVSDEIALRGNLRRWLMSALPPSRLTHIPGEFEGDADSLSFLTLADTPFAPMTALLQISVAAEADQLIMALNHLDDTGVVIQTERRVLLEDWNGGTFQYFDDGDEPGWRNQWLDQPSLPRLIKIAAEPFSTSNWPDFVVRPRLEP